MLRRFFSKPLPLIFVFLFYPIIALILPNTANAGGWNCRITEIRDSNNNIVPRLTTNDVVIKKLVINTDGNATGGEFVVMIARNDHFGSSIQKWKIIQLPTRVEGDNIIVEGAFDPEGVNRDGDSGMWNEFGEGTNEYIFLVAPKNDPHQDKGLCPGDEADVPPSMSISVIKQPMCDISFLGTMKPREEVKIKVTKWNNPWLKDKGGNEFDVEVVGIEGTNYSQPNIAPKPNLSQLESIDGLLIGKTYESGKYRVTLKKGYNIGEVDKRSCESRFEIKPSGGGEIEDDPGDDTTPNNPLSLPCDENDYTTRSGCLRIKTALGTVETGAPEFVRWVLGFVLGISGGIVLIIIIITGYRLMTSQGDPEKVKNAREQLTAAIVGLLFIIFSLVILQLITSDVLGLPGFGG